MLFINNKWALFGIDRCTWSGRSDHRWCSNPEPVWEWMIYSEGEVLGMRFRSQRPENSYWPLSIIKLMSFAHLQSLTLSMRPTISGRLPGRLRYQPQSLGNTSGHLHDSCVGLVVSLCLHSISLSPGEFCGSNPGVPGSFWSFFWIWTAKNVDLWGFRVKYPIKLFKTLVFFDLGLISMVATVYIRFDISLFGG